MPDSSHADRSAAERRYYALVDAAGTDTDLLLFAVAFGIREAGMTTDHPHIRAILAYCAAHEPSMQAGTVMAERPQPASSGKARGIDLH